MTQGAQTATAKILIVDDDPAIRGFLEAGLAKASYESVAVESPLMAEQALAEADFDLVLLDIVMPDKRGDEYLPELIKDRPKLAVVMLTGEQDVSTAVRLMREGALDYVAKPVGLAELIIRIEHALSRRSMEVENREYQRKLEQLVDELNATMEQRNRELTALNKLFRSSIGQGQDAQSALVQLEGSLDHFKREIEGLASIVGLPIDRSYEDKDTEDYNAQKVQMIGEDEEQPS